MFAVKFLLFVLAMEIGPLFVFRIVIYLITIAKCVEYLCIRFEHFQSREHLKTGGDMEKVSVPLCMNCRIDG